MSDTMKLIIEIPKKDYEWAIKIKEHQNYIVYCDRQILAIANGTPLDETTNWKVLKSIFPYAEIVGGDESLTAVKIDSNPETDFNPDSTNKIIWSKLLDFSQYP